MDAGDGPVAPTELVIFTQVQTDENDLSESTSNMTAIHLKDISHGDETVEMVRLSKIMHALPEEKVTTEAELYLCDKCNRTFKQKSRYERHIANHPNEKHYLCNTCQKTFTRMSHLEKHIRTHTEERRHVCEVCGAAFILPHHLVRHNLIHTGARPFECEICRKQFTRKAGLTQHQFVHTGVKPFSCDIAGCGKQFTDRTTLRRHMLTHSREKPFICKECDKTFRTKSACRKHYLRHFKGEEAFKCGVCEEMFKTEDLLKQHAIIHEQKQKTGAFRCGFCLRVFKSQNDLDSHVPLHETGMVHACNQCSAKFYTEADLFSHVTKHIERLTSDSIAEEKVQFTSESKSFHQPSQLPVVANNVSNNHMQTNETPTDNSKLVVVLQLPTSVGDVKESHDELRLENIQQLLGSAQIDKVLVTTDRISDSPAALTLQLTHDQQQGIQQILQTTNISSTGYSIPQEVEPDSMNNVNTLHVPGKCSDVTQSINDLSANETLVSSNELDASQSSYVLTSVPHAQEPQSKENTQYIIVPSYKDRNTTLVDGYNLQTGNSSTSKQRDLGEESVFKSSGSLLRGQSLVVVDSNGVVSIKDDHKILNHNDTANKVLSLVTSYGTPVFPPTPDQISSQCESGASIAAVAHGHRSLDNLDLEQRSSNDHKSFFSTGEFENSLAENAILADEETNFISSVA